MEDDFLYIGENYVNTVIDQLTECIRETDKAAFRFVNAIRRYCNNKGYKVQDVLTDNGKIVYNECFNRINDYNKHKLEPENMILGPLLIPEAELPSKIDMTGILEADSSLIQ